MIILNAVLFRTEFYGICALYFNELYINCYESHYLIAPKPILKKVNPMIITDYKDYRT